LRILGLVTTPRVGLRGIGHGALALGLAGVAAGLVAAVPTLAGTSWPAVVALLDDIRPYWVVVLAAVWFAGLLGYSLVLRASMPGLTTRQALSLNLAGSAVSNALPLGGAMSMGLTTAMARSWRFSPARLGAYFTVSNAWTAAGRLTAGVLGLSTLMLIHPGRVQVRGLGTLFAAVALATAAVVAVLGRERSTARVATRIGRLVDRLDSRRGRTDRQVADRLRAGAVEARRLSLGLSRLSWHRFLIGMTCYIALLVTLLALCLRAAGQPTALAVVFAAVGVERLAGVVPLTPGGVGVADLSMVTVLAATGGAPPAVAAAALLYRLFTFGLEIPVGATVALGWWLRRRARAQPYALGHEATDPGRADCQRPPDPGPQPPPRPHRAEPGDVPRGLPVGHRRDLQGDRGARPGASGR
jgi:putative heme transporter